MSSLAWRIATVITLLTLAAQFANAAQPECSPADTLIPNITSIKSAQTLAVVGTMKTPEGMIPVMTFTNSATHAWTMISRPTDEIACIIALGEGFEASYGDDPEESM